MILIRKFYDDGAGDGANGGGAGGASDNNGASGAEGASGAGDNGGAQPQAAAPLFSAEELKDMGYETVEAAKEGLRTLHQKSKIVDPTEEEKTKQANIDRADFLKYAAENDLVNEDFNKYESLSTKTDRDLVFEKFAAEFDEDNPDLTDEEFQTQVKLAFESEYKLSSENEKEKARGESRLKKDAKDLRAPSETSYNSAKESFNIHRDTMKKGEGYSKTFKEIVASIPDKLEVFKTILKKDDTDEGEEISVDLELKPEEKVSVEKKFFTAKNLRAYIDAEKEGKLAEFKSSLSKKMISFIKENREGDIYASIADKVQKIAMRYGSDVGAGQPFEVVKGGGGAGASGLTKTARQEAIDSTRRTAAYK